MSASARIRLACSYALLLLAFVTLPAPASPDRIYWNDFEPALSTAANAWTWNPFDDAKCGDGSSVGLGVT